MPFIKSHSNFVLKNRHQDVNDGTIFERDITTIGGLNQFSKGQTPIYKSGNFIITVRNDGRPSNQYNTSKWKENDSGDTWTLQTISGMVSDYEDQDDTKIVLKQDYYDFRDFAYYGSLTELFRASVTDIVARFPGELYSTYETSAVTDEETGEVSYEKINRNAYYKKSHSDDFDKIDDYGVLGSTNLTYVDNPFGIDIYSKKKPLDAEVLKYFADEGYKNYIMFKGDTYDTTNEDNYVLTSWTVSYNTPCAEHPDIFPIGSRVATVTLVNKASTSISIQVWVGDEHNIVYLTDSANMDIHIRPRDTFYARFWNECDNFQKLLINRDNGYKATFSVIRENDFGYYREFMSLVFPKGDGGYNIDATDYGFNAYTTHMVQIGEYYDENFTDNLWRSMTHEAIKNFDWTYTREYQEGDEEEYVLGGQKMQKALRIFAREFDEIISYINNIKNNNRVTYDERNNIPDYFLTDVVENEGWNVKMVYPYSLTEYVGDSRTVVNPETYTESGDCKGQLFNQEGDNIIRREFSQNSNNLVKPYSKSMIDDETEDGYFIVCKGDDCTDINTVEVTNPPIPCTGGTVEVTWKLTKEKGKRTQINTPCEYKCGLDEGEEPSFTFVRADDDKTLLDNCALSDKGVVKDRIKSYTDEKEWSYQDANNEFLRRLKINSPYIWRHKGTLEGIDMILGMFGLRNKKWVDSIPAWLKECKYKYEDGKFKYDYEVIEYTSFTKRIEEPWDVVHQDYRINWINSTKTIIYDNRFISNYTKYGANSNILTYQGIPVQYREAYDSEAEPYITKDTLEHQIEGIRPTANSGEAFVRMDGTPVKRRFLYPNFDKNEQLDGNPYFQMDGGWLSKKIHLNEQDSWVNFQFDVDDNIVFTDYKEEGKLLDNGFLDDNIFLYKETIRNIRRVDNINELLSLPTVELHNGIICSVTSIERNSAVIDGVVYPITTEWSSDSTNGHSVSYISFTKTDGFIKVGKNKFFDTTMMVYDIDGNQYLYDVDGMDDGLVIKAYIKDDGTFMCQEDETGNYSITYFQELDKYYEEEGYTNYFILDDINYAEELARFESDGDTSTVSGWTSGWRRLVYGDRDFLKINTITNDYNGNNPHNGNMVYDNGHEYFLYFKRLFKHTSENDLFDERCYDDFYRTLDDEIVHYGFNGLVENNDDILQYDDFLVEDSKIHYFGNYKTKKEDNAIKEVWIYGQDADRLSGSTYKDGEATNARGGYDKIYDHDKVSSQNIKQYILTKIAPYDKMATDKEVDEVTNQIVNNKRLTIRFYLHNKWYTEDGQNELKYIDDIVMNYLTQMIPSTTLLTIEYDLGHVIEEIVTEGTNPPSEGEESTIETETITEVYSSGINCENSIQTIATSTHFETTVTVVQAAGPCCINSTTSYTFSNVNLECRKYDEEQVQVHYVATITCDECPSRTEEGDSGYTLSVSCNPDSTERTFTFGGKLGSFTAIQQAGPCCPCECEDLTITQTTITRTASNTDSKEITI